MTGSKNWISIVGVFVGIGLSRTIGRYYGNDGRATISSFVVVMLLFSLIRLIVKKEYSKALKMCSIVVPLIMTSIGMYLDNLYLVIGGFILILILCPIMLKFTA